MEAVLIMMGQEAGKQTRNQVGVTHPPRTHPSRPSLLKTPQSPQTALPAEEQVFKPLPYRGWKGYIAALTLEIESRLGI